MKHFKTMREAVLAAAQLCPGWLVLESGEYIEAPAAEYLARVTDDLDREDDAASETYYLASDEGAVGVTSRYEYLAQWILIPVMRPMAELEAELEAQIAQQTQATRGPQRNMQEPAGAAGAAGAGAGAGTPAFCPWCGYKQQPGARFCPDCGRKFN